MATRQVRIEYHSVGDILKWPRNPKKHDLAAIQASLRHYGFVTPLIKDEGTGRLVVGHGRLEALAAMQLAGEKAPEGIEVGPENEWRVPVVVGVAFKDANQAEAFLLADNRLGERGGWDDDALLAMLRELESEGLLTASGFAGDDVDDLLARLNAVPELPAEPFEGGFGETPEEQAQRAAQGRDITMREVVLLFQPEAHAVFLEHIGKLRAAWGETTTTAVVAEAVRRAAEA